MFFFGLFLKLVIIYCVFLSIRKVYDGYLLYSLSWLFSYFLIILGMVGLSLFNALSGPYLLLYLFMIAAILLFVSWKTNKKDGEKKDSELVKRDRFSLILNIIFFVLILGFVVLLTFRNITYYDTTDDALTQGMTKLAFIQQNKSLFVHYDTWTINIFSNEWLGELNGLFYLLLTNEDHMILLGNVDIYIYIVISILGIIRCLQYKGNMNGLLAIYFSTIPVITGLAMTLKTDLISIILLPLAIVVILEYFEKETPFLLFATISVLGALVSSKITLVPVGGLLAIGIVIYYFTQSKNKPITPVLCGLFCALIFCIRYVSNLFVYGNPFQRALNEKVDISLNNLIENLYGIASRFTESVHYFKTVKPWTDANWVLNKGLGYGGEIALVLLVFGILINIVLQKKNSLKRNFKFIWLPYIVSFIFVLLGTKWFLWSFRYYFPYIFFLLILGVIGICNYLQKNKFYHAKKVLYIVYIILFISAIGNAKSAFRYGQAIPVDYISTKDMTDTQQKLLFSSWAHYDDLSQIEPLMDIFTEGGTGVILDEFSVPFYYFFGDDNCVKIDLVMYESQLIENYQDYDFIAIASQKYDPDAYSDFESIMKTEGYAEYIGSYGAVFIK